MQPGHFGRASLRGQLQGLRCNSLVILGEIGPHGQCGRSLAVTARLELCSPGFRPRHG